MLETRSINSKRNIISGLSGSLCVLLFGFIVRTILLRYFNEKYLGLTSVLGSLIAVLNLSELGLSTAIVANLYGPISNHDEKRVRGILNFYRRAYQIIGLLITTVGIAIMPFLRYLIKDVGEIDCNIYIIYILYLANTAVSYFLFTYKEALLYALQRYDLVKNIYTIIFVLKNCTQLITIIYFKNFYLFVFLQIVFTIVNSIFIEIVSRRIYPQYFCYGYIASDEKQQISKDVVGIAVGKILDVARNSLDSIIISLFWGLETVAIYNNYYYIYTALIGIIWVIVNAIQASVGNSIVTERVEKNFSDLIKFELIFSMFITICSVYLISLYQPFMKLWMGDDMLLSDGNMILFVMYFYSMSINGIRNAYFNGIGLWWKGRIIAVAEALLNLLLNIFLGRLFGVTGILIATIVTIILVNYICNTNLLFKEYFNGGMRTFFGDRIVYTLVTVLISIISFTTTRTIQSNGLTGLFIKFFITSGIIVIMVPTVYFVVRKKLFIDSLLYIRIIIGREKKI